MPTVVTGQNHLDLSQVQNQDQKPTVSAPPPAPSSPQGLWRKPKNGINHELLHYAHNIAKKPIKEIWKIERNLNSEIQSDEPSEPVRAIVQPQVVQQQPLPPKTVTEEPKSNQNLDFDSFLNSLSPKNVQEDEGFFGVMSWAGTTLVGKANEILKKQQSDDDPVNESLLHQSKSITNNYNNSMSNSYSDNDKSQTDLSDQFYDINSIVQNQIKNLSDTFGTSYQSQTKTVKKTVKSKKNGVDYFWVRSLWDDKLKDAPTFSEKKFDILTNEDESVKGSNINNSTSSSYNNSYLEKRSSLLSSISCWVSCRKGCKPTAANHDSYGIMNFDENFRWGPMTIISVFDGHGKYGERCSQVSVNLMGSIWKIR